MARIEYSALISSISGSIGPLTFRRKGASSIMQHRPPSKRMDSPAALLHRQYVAQANQDWAALPTDTKNFWKTTARGESARGSLSAGMSRNGRLFFIGWRLRCLHSGASCAPTVLPPLPLFRYDYFRMELYQPGLSVSWYNYPLGKVPPYPRVAAWISWPVNGTRRPGRRWFKFWPQPGHESAAYGVDLDSVLYGVMGYPPELTALVSGYYPWKVPPRVRSYGVYADGHVGVMAERDIQPPGANYYFKIPPDPPVYGGFAA